MAQQKGGEGVFGETSEGAAGVARPISVKSVAEVLRGVAQVDFMPSAVCGLLFVAALFAAGWQYGLHGLLGSAVSTAVGQGLLGCSGVLVAPALCGVFVAPGGWSAAYAVLGAAAATVLTPALGAISAPFGGHAFTWPFVLTTMLFLAAVPAIPRLRRV
ncbi:urea transporter [Kitasatospora sp. NPDC058190]|uniref:urea transporter n=1 Tax=Kitasatospora sp. NPDC058190 TaxID=3346371 RepID=UPI0036DBAC3C